MAAPPDADAVRELYGELVDRYRDDAGALATSGRSATRSAGSRPMARCRARWSRAAIAASRTLMRSR